MNSCSHSRAATLNSTPHSLDNPAVFVQYTAAFLSPEGKAAIFSANTNDSLNWLNAVGIKNSQNGHVDNNQFGIIWIKISLLQFSESFKFDLLII